MQLLHLRDVPDWLDRIAAAHVAEWGHLYENWTVADARAELATHRADGTIPFTRLLMEDGEWVGSVSVIRDDLPGREELNPWLANLYVRPEYRGRGCGQRLIAAALEGAAEQGETALVLFTESAVTLFEKDGFIPVEAARLRGHSITLMTINLPARAVLR